MEDLGYLESLDQPAQWETEDHQDHLGRMDSKGLREHQDDQGYQDSKGIQVCQEAEECRGTPAWLACPALKDHQEYQVKRATPDVQGPTAGPVPSALWDRRVTRALRDDGDCQDHPASPGSLGGTG